MADISDVEQAIVNLVSGVLYPSGTSSPSALPGANLVTVTRGWPLATDLAALVSSTNARVSVWPRGGAERNVTKYPVDYQTVTEAAATLTATVLSNTITIGGVVNTAIPQWVTVQIGPKFVTSYAPVGGDTLQTIAQALATAIQATFATATAVNGVVTVSSSAVIRAMVGVTASQIAEIRRQTTNLQITLWCPTPPLRDQIGSLLEPILSETTFLTMPDGSAARFRYGSTIMSDVSDKEKLYRRDMIYECEYATTLPDTAFEITDVVLNIDANDGAGGVAPPDTFNLPLPPVPANVQLPSKAPPYAPLNPN